MFRREFPKALPRCGDRCGNEPELIYSESIVFKRESNRLKGGGD
jgi:hypothetical protein